MGADLTSSWVAIDQHVVIVVGAIAMTSGVIAVRFGTYAAAGADASGYLSQAAMWGAGDLGYRDALAALPGWPANPWLTTALGWRPALEAGWQVPTYAPGLPLLMAIPHALRGTTAAAYLVAITAGIAVWATGTLAARLAGGAAGVVAALLLAVAPVFLFQSVQPMSDVPVTAAWMVCWMILARETGVGNRETLRVFAAGPASAIAVLIRPNLAPLAAIPLVWIWAGLRARHSAILFAIPVAVAGLFLAWLQWRWYGSPVQSGYGSAGELFALANIGPNLLRYPRWLIETSPALAVAPLGLLALRRSSIGWPMTAFAVLVAAAYLVYAVFDEWSYLRFVLPALSVAAVLVGVGVARGASALPSSWRAPLLFVLALALTAHGVSQARGRDAFALAGQLQRVGQLGAYLDASLPAGAVIVAGEQSGALRYGTNRSIVRWDLSGPIELRQALDALAANGRDAWIALDAWEEPLFRERFSGVPGGALDWPPAVDAGDTRRTRAWRLADRDRFLRDERVTTERLR